MCIQKGQNALKALEWNKRTTIGYSVKPRQASTLCIDKNHTWATHFMKVWYHRLHRIVFNKKEQINLAVRKQWLWNECHTIHEVIRFDGNPAPGHILKNVSRCAQCIVYWNPKNKQLYNLKKENEKKGDKMIYDLCQNEMYWKINKYIQHLSVRERIAILTIIILTEALTIHSL